MGVINSKPLKAKIQRLKGMNDYPLQSTSFVCGCRLIIQKIGKIYIDECKKDRWRIVKIKNETI